MVITAPEFRGRGLASRLLQAALAFLDARQTRWVKLDATPLGSHVYRKFGFVDECPVERWMRRPAPARAPHIAGRSGQWDPQLDLLAFGEDRSRLLSVLAPLESISIPGAGYAMGRPGSRAAYFGPCVATGSDAARGLIEWFLSRHASETIYWDLLPENRDALDLAGHFGFERSRELVRMARRFGQVDSLPTHSGQIYAIAGLELG